NNNNGGDQNQNNNNNGGDQNQNNNNNGGDQNQNNNNNGGDQNQNNNQQQDDPVSYPTLVQNINNGDVYRIVNKKSGKVMTIENGSDLKQAKRDENDKKQMFRLKETDGYYFMQNDDTKFMLTNKYVNNDGTKISQEEISEYDNPSQKWSIKKVNEWFTFSNKSDYSASKVLSVENASKQDNADIVIFTSNNQDEQLWGLEYVYTPTAVDNILFKDCVLTPTVISDEFHIVTSTGEETIVDIYTPNGVHCKHIEKECTYNVSDLAKGNYIVVVSGLDGNRILTQLIIKK
ncbi:MAG: RICIN domain-containing protein, partial [Paludibacteraceae bacterium]|nr:RICIN domain-containing protein [Paludibacteraceae bacterium]